MSEKIIELMVKFIEESTSLIHLNMNGMNLSRDHVLAISGACVKSELLCALHMSENSIRRDPELVEEVLDTFGLNV